MVYGRMTMTIPYDRMELYYGRKKNPRKIKKEEKISLFNVFLFIALIIVTILYIFT